MRALGSLPEIPGRSRYLGRGTHTRSYIFALATAFAIMLPGLLHSGAAAAFAPQPPAATSAEAPALERMIIERFPAAPDLAAGRSSFRVGSLPVAGWTLRGMGAIDATEEPLPPSARAIPEICP